MGRIKGKLLYLVSEDWYFCSHRLPLARAAKKIGYDIIVVTQVNSHADMINAEGFKLVPIVFQRSIRRPWKDLQTLISILRVYYKERPDIIHQVSLKPVFYGSLMALITNHHHPAYIINSLTGLGFIFTSTDKIVNFLRAIIQKLLKYLLHKKNTYLILQNKDDFKLFIENRIVEKDHVFLIRGSGVDIHVFKPSPAPTGIVTVMLVARLLRDKGVKEFVSAASQLRNQGITARFVLVGDTDNQNPSGIPLNSVEEWQSDGIIEWWGKRDDMLAVYQKAHIIVLPSYREGLPKVLLEAAACSLPIVTSDVPGCREIVLDGVNGLLVPPRNSKALAEAIKYLINKPELRIYMGRKGRELVEQDFSSEIIVSQTLDVYAKLL